MKHNIYLYIFPKISFGTETVWSRSPDNFLIFGSSNSSPLSKLGSFSEDEIESKVLTSELGPATSAWADSFAFLFIDLLAFLMNRVSLFPMVHSLVVIWSWRKSSSSFLSFSRRRRSVLMLRSRRSGSTPAQNKPKTNSDVTSKVV